ncbi:cytosine-specific methyltransferase [Botrytis cinerea]
MPPRCWVPTGGETSASTLNSTESSASSILGHSNNFKTDIVSQPLATSRYSHSEQHQSLESSNSALSSLHTMLHSGNFIRGQSNSTDDSELLQPQLIAEQLILDQISPTDADGKVATPSLMSKVGTIQPTELIYPKSLYHGYIPPLPASKEHFVCSALLQEFKKKGRTEVSSTQEDFVEFELAEFSIYMPDTALYGHELRGLQDLASKLGHSCFLFDGVLSLGNFRYYVQGVPFKVCSIGNYGEEFDDVDGAIWLQSDLNIETNIYYRLKKPASEYSRFHLGFSWLANLSKHFVDYSLACQGKRERVSIHKFRADFAQWCQKTHTESSKFQSWYLEYGRDDFRQAISANINFLFKESVGVTSKLRSLYIWKEALELTSIKEHPIKENMTIVTPYVYECFSHLRFGHLLKPLVPTIFAENVQEPEDQSLSLSPRKTRISCDPTLTIKPRGKFFYGRDVLSVTKDGADSVWKDESSKWKTEDSCWYLYVQIKHQSLRGNYSFDGIWLYKPSDTSCAKMKYPYAKELFLSDNCTCGSRDSRIAHDEVIDIIPIIWHGLPSETDIFVRQTYLRHEIRGRFVIGIHDRSSLSYWTNDTCFTPRRNSKNNLEPYEIVGYVETSSKLNVTLRRLLRRSEIDHAVSCRPNELVYTNLIDTISAHKLEKACLVRFYTENQVSSGSVPAPYCRDGGSNAFIITKRLCDDNQTLVPIESDAPQTLIQVLNGLDLFCGGGNFGRGLEESGVLHNKWAVDLFSAALQTYAANLKNPEKTDLYFGSVNDLLSEAFVGNPQSLKIPLPGDVDVIMAGSPCQGFSRMNSNKGNDQSLRNQSLIASNVLNMAQKGLRRDEDVLSQLICTIVGLGYQVQLFLLDSWSFGSSQSRSRIFVSFAAPANGQSFGSRVHCPTPFHYRTAEQSVADLPYIGDGATGHCTKYPDHVSPLTLSRKYRSQIACIPTHPRGMSFSKTWNEGNGIMTKEERDLFPYLAKSGRIRESVVTGSRAWGRIQPHKLFPTVLVVMNMEDSRMGAILHWDQHRRLTLLELRRAQSFPDDEVIIGRRGEQIKIIGNSVDRTVSMALGISLRKAWLECSPEVDMPKRIVRAKTSVASRERSSEVPVSTGSTTLEVNISQRPKHERYGLEAPNGVSNGPVAFNSSSSGSVGSVGSSLSGFGESGSFDSAQKFLSDMSKMQKRRQLIDHANEPARKSPRLSPAWSLSSKSREPVTNSTYNLNPILDYKSTKRSGPRDITTPSTHEPRLEIVSPDLYSASPPSKINSPYQSNTLNITNHANKHSHFPQHNSVTMDDNKDDNEDTIWVESGPRVSNLLHRTLHSRTTTSRTASILKNSTSNSSHAKKRSQFIDLTTSDSEDQNLSATCVPRSSLQVIIPAPVEMEKRDYSISSAPKHQRVDLRLGCRICM